MWSFATLHLHDLAMFTMPCINICDVESSSIISYIGISGSMDLFYFVMNITSYLCLQDFGGLQLTLHIFTVILQRLYQSLYEILSDIHVTFIE